MKPWVKLETCAGHTRLYVHDRPFVSLGIQLDHLYKTIEDFEPYIAHAAKMGCNTVFFPIMWRGFEPEEGKIDFSVLDHVLGRARELDVYVSLLWFGTNQGGTANPAPKWLRENTAVYRPIMDEQGKEQKKLCPRCPATLAAEKRALEAMLEHLHLADPDRRVIFLQVENEPCLEMNSKRAGWGALMDGWSFRCHCPVCDEAFAKEGVDEWTFAARSLTGYFTKLLARQKELYPVLSYTNFLLNPQRPGEDVDVYLAECPEIDIVAVDYYGFCAADLAFTMRFFERGRNVPFIAEHSTESVGDAAGNVYRAVCEHGVVAFDPWAIDHTFGWRNWRDRVHERPFVGTDGSWTDAATAYARSLAALGGMTQLVARAARTSEMMFYVTEHDLPRSLEERRWGLVWRTLCGPEGRWVCVRSGDGDFTFGGVGLQLIVEPLDPKRSCEIERGRWKNGVWERTGDAPVQSKTERAILLELEEGACVRIRLV
jgi:hypothetical protein